jgi:hypothetical protein
MRVVPPNVVVIANANPLVKFKPLGIRGNVKTVFALALNTNAGVVVFVAAALSKNETK